MFFLQKLLNINSKKLTSVVVVSGLPRSGTSMMMQILDAGGIEPITDNVRVANKDNANGYYEHEEVKALARGVHSSLSNARGRAIKVISTLLKFLPSDRRYKVIFMHRELDEVLASQTKMLDNLNSQSKSSDDEMKLLYTKHLTTISKWLNKQKHIDMLSINYADILNSPADNIDLVAGFLDIKMNKRAMIKCVDQNMRHHVHKQSSLV